MKLSEALDTYYHGTSRKLSGYITPPVEHGLEIQERGRKKNLDKVFITKDIGSAKIYAGRAKNVFGGKPVIYIVEPQGKIETINDTKGTTVYAVDKAKIKGVVK
tara:strand:+ start:525 stop:836 length:312 start_codon:yes stop_codon:yes gene_type:complete